MKMFIVRLENGDYITNVQLTSTYLYFEHTRDRAAASQLNDFDSQLVLKRLRNMGEKNPRREQVTSD